MFTDTDLPIDICTRARGLLYVEPSPALVEQVTIASCHITRRSGPPPAALGAILVS
jgi:hypothetical protein